MKSLFKTTRQTTHPFWLFFIFLTTTFAVEITVMFALPFIIPQSYGIGLNAMFDAFCLTAVLGPFVWFAFIAPLQRASQLRAKLLDRVLQVQEEERGRISRDLHDGIGQMLTGLMIRMKVIEEATAEPITREQIRSFREQGVATHEELRRLVRGLRPLVLDDVGLVPAIERLLGDARSIHSCSIDFQTNLADHPRLSPPLETSVYRIVQEALNNALSHGKPDAVQVELFLENGELLLEVRDNGQGFSPDSRLEGKNSPDSFGLLTMKERFAQFHGQVSIESRPGKGTSVKGRCPVRSVDFAHE